RRAAPAPPPAPGPTCRRPWGPPGRRGGCARCRPWSLQGWQPMAYFILGLVVGLGAGVAVTQQVHEMRRRREAALQAGATIAEPPPSTTTARLLAQDVTRDAARSALADDGYGDGLALDGGELSCDGCGTRHPIDLIEAERVFRFEDDGEGVTILLGLRCPACGA